MMTRVLLNCKQIHNTFAVLITDEPITEKDNRCGKSTTDVALELEEAGIITCVVSNGANTFGPLYQYTDGIQMSVYSDFHSYLYDFMTEYLKQMSGFNFVSANSLCSKFLEESLVRGGVTDTDGDTLTDSEEVDWNCIDVIMNGKEHTSEDGIVIALPTFEQVLGYSNFYDAETYDRISPYYRNAIRNINILPIKSDPTSVDGDNDGVYDKYDGKPLFDDKMPTHFAYLINNYNDIIKYENIIYKNNVYVCNQKINNYYDYFNADLSSYNIVEKGKVFLYYNCADGKEHLGGIMLEDPDAINKVIPKILKGFDKLQNERYKYFKKYGFNDAKGLTLSLTPGIFVFNSSLSLTVDKYNSIVLELSGGCGVSTDALPGASIGMFHTIALDDSNIDIGSTLPVISAGPVNVFAGGDIILNKKEDGEIYFSGISTVTGLASSPGAGGSTTGSVAKKIYITYNGYKFIF